MWIRSYIKAKAEKIKNNFCNKNECSLDSIESDKDNNYLCDLKKLEQSCVKYYEYLYESQLIKIFNNTYWRIETKIPKYDINLSFESLIDFTFISKKKTSAEKINIEMIKASNKLNLKGILTTNKLPLVSVDFNHNPSSSIFDLTQTQVINQNFCRVLSWYDNEWGFSNRMIDTLLDLKKFI